MQRFPAYKGFSFLSHKEIDLRISSDLVLRAHCEQFRDLLGRYHAEPRSDVSDPVLKKFSEITKYLKEHHGLRVDPHDMTRIELVTNHQQKLFT